MELKAPFFEKLYRKLYTALYKRERGIFPDLSKKLGSKIWTTQIKVGDNYFYPDHYYFDTPFKHFYKMYLDAKKGKDISIESLHYFKAMLFLNGIDEKACIIDKTKYPELDFLKIFKEHKTRKKQEDDVFLNYYEQDKLDDLHCVFAEENLPKKYTDEIIERSKARKLKIPVIPTLKDSSNILTILDKRPDANLHEFKIGLKEKEILYLYIFDQTNPIYKRISAIKVFCIHHLLSDDEISNLLHCSVYEIHKTTIFNLLSFVSTQNNLEEIIYDASTTSEHHGTYDILYYGILPDIFKTDFMNGMMAAFIMISLYEGRMQKYTEWGDEIGNYVIRMINFHLSLSQNFPYQGNFIERFEHVVFTHFAFLNDSIHSCELMRDFLNIVCTKYKKLLQVPELDSLFNFIISALIIVD